MDITGFGMVAVAFVLRVSGGHVDISRALYCYAIVDLSGRFVQVFLVFKSIGPQVFMIRMMASTKRERLQSL